MEGRAVLKGAVTPNGQDLPSACQCLQNTLSLLCYSSRRSASCTERSSVPIHTLLLSPASARSWLPPSSGSLCCALLVAKERFNCQSRCNICNFHLSERFDSVSTASLICKDLIYCKLVQKTPSFGKKKSLKRSLNKSFLFKDIEEFKLERKWRCIKNVFITENQNFFHFSRINCKFACCLSPVFLYAWLNLYWGQRLGWCFIRHITWPWKRNPRTVKNLYSKSIKCFSNTAIRNPELKSDLTFWLIVW